MIMEAPGAPGISPTWTSSDKDMIGTALGPSRVWFTLGHGILNEVYFPRVDLPQIRDLGFIVANGQGFWSEVKRSADYTISTPSPGIPAVEVLHRHARFEFSLRIIPDPERDALLVEVRLTGEPDLMPYALLAPHLGGTGRENRAEVFTNRGRVALCAEQGPFALALAAADAVQGDAWHEASAGYVGVSDGWQDFNRNGRMTWWYDWAGPGNVALIGRLPREAVLALGFGSCKEAAATLAISALAQPFETVWHEHVRSWRNWHADKAHAAGLPGEFHEPVHLSAMVLKAHQDKTYPGAMVASLSIPWGNSSDDVGGYHLVWPRDLVESAGALLELGAAEEARNALRYLIATQLEDGRWAQNQWLGGTPRWGGIQLDEVAFPVLLAAMLAERNALDGIEVKQMVRRALAHIVRHGPASDQDRWEETAGVNTFTLAVTIAALVCGAEFLDPAEQRDVLLLADDWNERIEEWCAALGDTPLAARHGVGAYHVRIAPARVIADRSALRDVIPLKNREDGLALPASEQVSTDFLQLVRFGLRPADDPIVRNTLAIIDSLLQCDTPSGPVWHRYNGDGYGEHPDGRPYDGTGRGRPWPLLAGERGHYALMAGGDPVPYLRSMLKMSGRLGLLPEQVWGGGPVPERGLFPGRPSGSAMPLAWAHSEFVKLAVSAKKGYPVDRPEAVWLRYAGQKPHPERAHWTPRMPVSTIQKGRALRLLNDTPMLVRWTTDGVGQAAETPSVAGVVGLHVVELPTEALRAGQVITFSAATWEGPRYAVKIIDDEAPWRQRNSENVR
jgi:glucoamylase